MPLLANRRIEREAIRKSAYVEKGEPHGGLGGRCAEPREPAVTPGQLAANVLHSN